ncbi:MAG: SH3 domain-containing protein [Saccharofermentanales bacterium]
MKTIAKILMMLLICFSLSGCADDLNNITSDVLPTGIQSQDVSPTAAPGDSSLPTMTPTKVAEGDLDSIKVLGNNVNVRQDHSLTGEIVMKISSSSRIYGILDEAVDQDGKTWYQIEVDFGVKGWIAGWLCTKTAEPGNAICRSKPGELLNGLVNKDLFTKLMLVEDYTVASLTSSFGKDYVQSNLDPETRYDYTSGLYFSADKQGIVYEIGIGELIAINPESVRRKTCNIFGNPGDEVLIIYKNQHAQQYFFHHELLVIDAAEKAVLRNYSLSTQNVSDFETEGYLNDGGLQLFIREENRDGADLSAIYKVVEDDFVRIYHTDSFASYIDGIRARISGSDLSLDIKVGTYSKKYTSQLPAKLFYSSDDIPDKNTLLSVVQDWDVEQIAGKWMIRLRNVAELTSTPENSITAIGYDLARVDILLEPRNGTFAIAEIGSVIKYDDPDLLEPAPVLLAEAKLQGGPALGMTPEEAYKALKGDMNGYKSDEPIVYNGVSVFCIGNMDVPSKVVAYRIMVASPDYATTRGLKVGDPIAKVENLYGKPDVGFSGDASATYHFVEDFNGKKRVSWGNYLKIHYSNGIVESYEFYQFQGDV